jgi:lipopolysaccharide/colanic/teichoic acid biosynthesis glycosyltransferase
MLPIMVILKLTGEHYIFYTQPRVGRYGKEFALLKFATMLKDSPNLPGGFFTTENDPRILPLGKFLRKTKINELPQLINILKGDMSVVGYRPLVRQGYELYSDEMKQKTFNFKPGLSGMGSIALRREEEIMQRIGDKSNFYKNVIMPYKSNLEIWYIDRYNLMNYFKIIFVTIVIVLNSSSCICEKVFKGLPETPYEIVMYKE